MADDNATHSNTKGAIRRGAEWVGGHVIQVIVGVAVALATPFVTGLVTPQQVGQKVAEITSTKISNSSTVRLTVNGDSAQVQRVAENARNSVLAHLRVPTAAADASLAYRLSKLELGTGATRHVTLKWIVALPGQDQVQCGPREISFYSVDTLAEQVASSLNNSIAATARYGRNRCD